MRDRYLELALRHGRITRARLDRQELDREAGFAAPYKVSGTATEYVRVGDQGSRFTVRFCPVCGTNLFRG